MHSTLKQKIVSGIVWRGLERFGISGMGLLVSVVLARLLQPSDFGVLALLTIFITISNVLVDSGFGIALVQKKAIDRKDLNSVFILNILVSAITYLILFCCAPWVSVFYNQPILTSLLRWIALSVLINALNGVPNAILIREMEFRFSFAISLCQTVSSGLLGISMALLGYGVWALVASALGGSLIGTIVRWRLVGWSPTFDFSLHRIGSLFPFGSRLLMAGVLDSFFTQIYGLIIGKYYSPSDLAYYNRGDSVPGFVMDGIQGSVGGVAFPAMASVQDDTGQLKMMMRKVLTTVTFFVFPAMCCLAVTAKPLVIVLLSEKWIQAVPYMQLACLTYMFYPMHVMNLQVVNACGRSDVYLRLEIIKKILICGSLVTLLWFGVMALAACRALVSVLCILINAYPNKGLINYPVGQQIRDVFPSMLFAVVLSGCVFGAGYGFGNAIEKLVIQIAVGGVLFMLGAWFFFRKLVVSLSEAVSGCMAR